MYRKSVALLALIGICLTTGAAGAGQLVVKVNFQLATTQTPAGYLPDTGLVYGDRGNGYSYGWSRDISADTRERNNAASKDKRYDTMVHLQKSTAAIWEIAIPNGKYNIFLVCGDVSNSDQTNNMDVEGVVFTDPDGADNIDEFTGAVEVKDGRLTVKPAAGASNSKICFIDITQATVPGSALEPIPANKATDVPRDVVLAWTAGQFARTHNVYLGTSFADVNNGDAMRVSAGQTVTTYEPADVLPFGQTYYWRVDEVNAPPTASTVFKGDVWSFTVEPYAYPIQNVMATASNSQMGMGGPEKTVDGSGLNADDQHSVSEQEMWLSAGTMPNWIQYEFDRVYKVHELWVWNQNQAIESIIGFGAKSVKIEYSLDGTTWTELAGVPEFAQGTGTATYVHNTTVAFGGVSAKYVKLTVNSSWGGLTQTGLSEVRFFHIPVQARGPEPAAAGTGVDLNATLSWRPGREAASHKVYFGKDMAAVTNGTAPVQTVADHSFTPGTMEYGQTYYWRVDEVNEAKVPGTHEGAVWSFTTQEYQVVDDFESYTVEEGNRIYEFWIDGYADKSSGSQVGLLDPPFAEQTIVHGGKQSMPLFYDNTAPLSFSEAVLTFDASQNWTANGIKSLSLFVRGAADNTGKLYLKVNSTKVPYSGAATDIALPLWLVWNIDLSTVGGNLSKVTSLTIGIEGAGSKGVIYVDDIRLSPAAVAPIQPVITGVVRANGQLGTRTDASPITTFNGSTMPLLLAGALLDGATVFSDRPYPWAGVPAEMAGADYVLTFNQDKTAGETDVTYTVTLSRAATVFLTCDDRITDQQAAVDRVVAAFATPGQFKNTGLKILIRENATTDRPMSVFAADLPAGTYVFGAQDSGFNFYTIAAKGK